ncbi:MAG: hypothetical protein KBT03_12805 [Bacteroidales bacterium]|nr:hypothetical protein [Candidatus Scybalousia scybalohippi]
MLLEINGNDYSKNILVGTYEVNAQDEEIDSWVDATGKTHKTVKEKTSGSMSMWFRSNVDYWQFIDDLEAVKSSSTSAHMIKVARNNKREMLEAEFYLELKPTRGRNAANQDEYRDFELSIQER